MLPARFGEVSFDSFQTEQEDSQPEQIKLLVEGFADIPDRPSRWSLRRSQPRSSAGLFLVGPPGVGKTHLLASAYRAATGPKLYASFDELVAAAGPLGMADLLELLDQHQFVCIDEVVLEDPGNITMLVTILQRLLADYTRILATANMPPDEAGGPNGWVQSFNRELGAITTSFEIHRLSGRDRRLAPTIGGHSDDRNHDADNGRVLKIKWHGLVGLLTRTHPMYDAAWLERIDRIVVEDQIQQPDDKDRALRFIRFIDRVYDRDVSLSAKAPPPAVESLVEPLIGDPRYTWHVERGRSRLQSLLSPSTHEQLASREDHHSESPATLCSQRPL